MDRKKQNISIAERVLGTPELESADAMRRAYCTVTGEQLSEQDFLEESARLADSNANNKWPDIPRNTQGLITTHAILEQVFVEVY